MVKMMSHVPAATPVTSPLDGLTVATLVLLLLQAPVPPDSTTLLAEYAAVAVAHRGVVPDTDPTEAAALIVTACCADFVPPHPPVIV
jgi:hypothetical protein